MKTDELLKRAKENEKENSVSFANKDFESEAAARQVFSRLTTRLTDIGEWNKHALMSSYALFSENGKEIESGKITVGAFLRVHLAASGKNDWIRVLDFYKTANEFIITVKPTFDPTAEKPDEKVISHFFTDESTNNFCVRRKNRTVTFYVIGLDEKRNTSETGGALETVRNVLVNVATFLGTQKSEWEKFCHHFLADAASGCTESPAAKE